MTTHILLAASPVAVWLLLRWARKTIQRWDKETGDEWMKTMDEYRRDRQ